jgi:hypothetical protein
MVSIICTADAGWLDHSEPHPGWPLCFGQHRFDVTHGAGGADRQKFSRDVILIMRFPSRPSRLNAISMPRVLRNACDLRNGAASARGFFGQSGILSARACSPKAVAFCSSDAVPTHIVCLAIILRTQAATGSASTASSTARRRLLAGPKSRTAASP